ncbi:MAG: 2OG-Fe(II) oxygenase, partial [Alphaproteobacteria bacterium]|nr:2OG-Fe(II) oxygenase [Alphaproteobacteria bacterium]
YRQQAREAKPFPFICIENFLEPEFAREVMNSYPAYGDALRVGHSYHAVNEKKKVQVSDAAHFPAPVLRLHEALAAPEFCAMLSEIFSIPNLLADPLLDGGGMHMTASKGHLDVHVDFNYIEDRKLHRRLNILVYLNENWDSAWGGNIELWDKEVAHCHHSFAPVLNRCVVFETSDVSYHGVTPIQCPPGRSRNSFAAYYYTREAPAHWKGQAHSTIFRARPHEVLKARVLMPLEKTARRAKRIIKGMLGQ